MISELFLNTITSLLEGLPGLIKLTKNKKIKLIKRRLVLMQLSLQEIIDNAEILLKIAKKPKKKTKRENHDMVLLFQKALIDQIQRLQAFHNLMRDDISEKIIKTFAPNLRRKILSITHNKIGALNYISESIRHLLRSRDFPGIRNFLILDGYSDWEHQRFINSREDYLYELFNGNRKQNSTLSNYILEQEALISSLNESSEDFARFINDHIDFNEAIGLIKKKSR